MKKLMLIAVLVGLMATPALALPTGPPDNLPDLSTWTGGNATHQYWTFSPDNVSVVIPGTSFNATPDEQEPFLGNTVAAISADPGTLTYEDGTFYGDNITVNLKIYNYPQDNAYKLIWVDVGYEGSGPLQITGISATDHGVNDYTYSILQGQGDADFGIKIVPNPWWEEIEFMIPGTSGAELYYIHADTVCIPAPGAILLGSIGVCFVGWLRRRRTL